MNKYMKLALKEAKKAEKKGEVPVGAVAVFEGEIIAKAHNQVITKNDPTAHAEILLLKKVARKLGNYRLNNIEVYVTKEPCLMCIGALVNSRIKKLYFGAYDPIRGGVDVYMRYFEKFNHHFEIEAEVEKESCEKILKDFFLKRRGTEVVVTGSTRNRFSGDEPGRGFESLPLRQRIKNKKKLKINKRRGVRVA